MFQMVARSNDEELDPKRLFCILHEIFMILSTEDFGNQVVAAFNFFVFVSTTDFEYE